MRTTRRTVIVGLSLASLLAVGGCGTPKGKSREPKMGDPAPTGDVSGVPVHIPMEAGAETKAKTDETDDTQD